MNAKVLLGRDGCCGVAMAAAPTHAQDIPAGKPIHIIVGFAPGGATDIVARVLATRLSENLGQQVIVENRSGGGGTIATEQVARAEPDGTTLLMTPLANAVNETLAAKTLKARFGENLPASAPVGGDRQRAGDASVAQRENGRGADRARQEQPPGDILAASSGRGTSTQLTTELFNLMAGIKLGVVHYRGGGDITKDLLSGQVKLMFATIAPVLQYIKAGYAARHRHDGAEARQRPARSADGRRVRAARLRRAAVACDPGAGRHAARDHRPAGCRNPQGAGGARSEDGVRRAGLHDRCPARRTSSTRSTAARPRSGARSSRRRA